MTALAASRNVENFVDQQLRTFKVKGSTTVYRGAFVGLASGYARGLVAEDLFIGIAYEECVNAGSDGAKVCRIYTQGDFALPLASVAQANVGAPVYASDSGDLTLTATDMSYVGFVVDVLSANLALVRIDPFRTAP